MLIPLSSTSGAGVISRPTIEVSKTPGVIWTNLDLINVPNSGHRMSRYISLVLSAMEDNLPNLTESGKSRESIITEVVQALVKYEKPGRIVLNSSYPIRGLSQNGEEALVQIKSRIKELLSTP